MLVDSENENDDDEEDLDDHGDSDGSANSPVYSSSVLSFNQRRKGLKRTFLTSTPSSTTSYKRHFHEGRLLSERLILGELLLLLLLLTYTAPWYLKSEMIPIRQINRQTMCYSNCVPCFFHFTCLGNLSIFWVVVSG